MYRGFVSLEILRANHGARKTSASTAPTLALELSGVGRSGNRACAARQNMRVMSVNVHSSTTAAATGQVFQSFSWNLLFSVEEVVKAEWVPRVLCHKQVCAISSNSGHNCRSAERAHNTIEIDSDSQLLVQMKMAVQD